MPTVMAAARSARVTRDRRGGRFPVRDQKVRPKDGIRARSARPSEASAEVRLRAALPRGARGRVPLAEPARRGQV